MAVERPGGDHFAPAAGQLGQQPQATANVTLAPPLFATYCL
jgi:hypothetical protein